MNRHSQSSSTQDPHRWAHQRFLPLKYDLLDPREAAEVQNHLDSCPPCARDYAVESAARTPPEERGHIPARILANWRAAGDHLRGVERQMVAQHLDHCADCRNVLAILGQDPVLAPLAQRSPESPAAHVSARRALTGPRRGLRFNWLLAGTTVWAVAATLAAVLLNVARNPTAPLMVADHGTPGKSSEAQSSVAGTVNPEAQGEPQVSMTPVGRELRGQPSLELATLVPAGVPGDRESRRYCLSIGSAAPSTSSPPHLAKCEQGAV
ncbi:MAG: zf-HC2 domain-containing protein [bacterium]|nr:zf-HC2 domain-containing protein [bacterium]